jgi:hypothetical protein
VQLKALEAKLLRADKARNDETKALRERMAERVKELENEIDYLRSEEQTERYQLLNVHIEQQAQLNTTLKNISRENQELNIQLKQVENERDMLLEQK